MDNTQYHASIHPYIMQRPQDETEPRKATYVEAGLNTKTPDHTGDNSRRTFYLETARVQGM